MNTLMQLQIDLRKSSVLAFLAAKDRMPENRQELGEWLLEFTEQAFALADRFRQGYEDHLRICTQVVQK